MLNSAPRGATEFAGVRPRPRTTAHVADCCHVLVAPRPLQCTPAPAKMNTAKIMSSTPLTLEQAGNQLAVFLNAQADRHAAAAAAADGGDAADGTAAGAGLAFTASAPVPADDVMETLQNLVESLPPHSDGN